MTEKADTKFKRVAERGSHDFDLACEVLDAGKICHVGSSQDEQTYVAPMAYARLEDQLLIHGSVASSSLRPSAVCMAKSRRSVSWSLRSS